jgi:hypothetical protein
MEDRPTEEACKICHGAKFIIIDCKQVLCKCELIKVILAKYPFLLGNNIKNINFKHIRQSIDNIRKTYTRLPSFCIKSLVDYPATMYNLAFLLSSFGVESYEFFTVHTLIDRQFDKNDSAFFVNFRKKIACIAMSECYWSDRQLDFVLQFLEFMALTGGTVIFVLFGKAIAYCPERLTKLFETLKFENIVFKSEKSDKSLAIEKRKPIKSVSSNLYTT